MTSSSEEHLKIAVFIDFDNIAIGVKQSLNRNFDVGTVLEAIKERGQVISKIAYGDWKRAEDFSRAMTQHAVQMVQRNLTPGGDKNGADIALALDALEMAFTRDHINAFVIVGGDSDFIALVEKLKQYDKTVFVVGGRAFTSVILQKNCHEFISYENLLGIQTSARRSTGKAQAQPPAAALDTALPLVRRALKVLSDREVSPQLGLLKSTLLQLDSTFSERDYGVSSFRDFIQKLADAGYVNLKQVDRSLLVELTDSGDAEEKEVPETALAAESAPEASAQAAAAAASNGTEPAAQPVAQGAPQAQVSQAQAAEAVKALEGLLRESKVKPHWPMYLRTFKQFLRSLQPPFDERQFGVSSTYELARQAQRDGLLRVERNRQGILRIYPADRFPKPEIDQPVEEAVPIDMVEPESGIPPVELVATAAQPFEPDLDLTAEPEQEQVLEPQAIEEAREEVMEAASEPQVAAEPPVIEAVEPEPEESAAPPPQPVIEEVIEEQPAPKPKAKRTRKTTATAAKATRTTRPRKKKGSDRDI